jgi:hypothetical protein
MMKRKILFALSILLISAAPQAAFAADDGSLDSMWMEQDKGASAKVESVPVGTTSTPIESAPIKSTPIEPAATAAPTANAGDDTAAPMCTLQNFKTSAIVSKGGWPGVGPFNADTENDYLDAHKNKLHVEVNGEQITRAQLDLTDRTVSGNTDKDLLDMQMNIDFFLEAVGIKPSKIQDLNAQLAKQKQALFAAEVPLSLRAGRCAVTIEKKRAEGNKLDYVINVASLDANQQIVREHAAIEPTHVATPVQPPVKQPDTIVMTPPTVSKKPVTAATPTTTSTATPKPVATAAKPVSESALKSEFASLITSWQKIKSEAVKSKSTDELGNVLAGKALQRQTNAVTWLQTNKKHYEMSPKGVTVDQIAVLAPAKKYMVDAQVNEAYKFIDDATGKVLNQKDEVTKVTYTVENVSGKWLIVDSMVPATASNKKTTR